MREGRMDRTQLECYCKWLTDRYKAAEDTIEGLNNAIKEKDEQIALLNRVLQHTQEHSKCEELKRLRKLINAQQSTIQRITRFIYDFCDIEVEKLEKELKGDDE